MFTPIGKTLGGAVFFLTAGAVMLAMGAYLIANPASARDMQAARSPAWVFGALLLFMAAVFAANVVIAFKKASVRVGFDWLSKSAQPGLYRLFVLAHGVAAAGFAAVGVALLI